MPREYAQYSSLIIVLVIAIALFIPTLAYPITADSHSFVQLTEGLVTGDMPEDFRRLPMLPLFAVPFALVTGSLITGITLAALFFGIISIIVWFCIGRELFNDTKIFPFLILAPYLIMFILFRPLAEAPLICFSLLSILFFIMARKHDRRYFYLSGIFFGLASLSRYAGLVLGISYILYYLVQRKRPSREFTLGIVLGFLIFATVPIANTIAYGSPFPSIYLEKIGGLLVEVPWYTRFAEYLGLQILFLLALTHLLIPHAIKGISRVRENLLFVLLIILGLVFAGFSGCTWRYVVPILPFVLILAFSGFRHLRMAWLKHLFLLGVIINILLVPYFVNGQAKDLADKIYAGPITWGQVGLRNANTLAWANQNLPENATLLIPEDYTEEDPIWSEYLRDDINVTVYAYLDQAPDSFYMLYDYNSASILKNSLSVYPNGTVCLGPCDSLQNLHDYITSNFDQTIVFQDTGLPVTTIRLVEK